MEILGSFGKTVQDLAEREREKSPDCKRRGDFPWQVLRQAPRGPARHRPR